MQSFGVPHAVVKHAVARASQLQSSRMLHATSKAVLRAVLGTALFWQPDSHGAEPVVAVAAVPPALGGSHTLHIMLMAVRPPEL